MMKEKRSAPRVRVRVPVKLATGDGSCTIDASTLDLSCVGAYCRACRFIPLNSEVDVRLGLPSSDVLCKGIVVRNKKGPRKDTYGIALFLSSMDGSDRQKIIEFIDEKLREEGVRTRSSKRKIRDFVKERRYVSKKGSLEISSAKFRVMEGDMVISSKGLMCQTDREVPLFKEIAVNIMLPPGCPGAGEAIQCRGVVVSCQKVRGKRRYDLTLYFEDLPARDRAALDAFVESGKEPADSPLQ